MNVSGRTHRRILVARPDRIGDVVLSTPVFHTLKAFFPDSFVGALVSTYTAPLLTGNPYVDAIITDDPEKENFWKKLTEIRKYRFDTALLLLPKERLAYLLFLAGIPYRLGVGHILYEVITFTRGVSRKRYNPLKHESDYMLDLVRRILPNGRIDPGKIWMRPEVFLNDEEKRLAQNFMEQKGIDMDRPVVGIHPGSGHSSPNWEPGRYSELANKLAGAGLQVLVTGSAQERKMEEIFSKTADNRIKTSFGELSLRELASVISQTSLLVSSSTGPMHIASAVGTATVSMFCPLTNCSPELWGPIGNVSRVILPPKGFCQEKCPGNPHVCTFGSGASGITVKEVFESVIQVINRPEAVGSGNTGRFLC